MKHLFKDNPEIDYYEVECKGDQTFKFPTQWPKCVDKLDCQTPFLDEAIMTHNWDQNSVGLTPPFDIE